MQLEKFLNRLFFALIMVLSSLCVMMEFCFYIVLLGMVLLSSFYVYKYKVRGYMRL